MIKYENKVIIKDLLNVSEIESSKESLKAASNKLRELSTKIVNDILKLYEKEENCFVAKAVDESSSHLILEALKNSYDEGASEVIITCLSDNENGIGSIIIDDHYDIKPVKILPNLINDEDFVKKEKCISEKKEQSNQTGGNNLGLAALRLAGQAYSDDFKMTLTKSPSTNGVRLQLVAQNLDRDFLYHDACKLLLSCRKNESIERKDQLLILKEQSTKMKIVLIAPLLFSKKIKSSLDKNKPLEQQSSLTSMGSNFSQGESINDSCSDIDKQSSISHSSFCIKM